MPDLMRACANPPAPPSPVTSKSIDTDYSAYGWHVVLDRPVVEFSRLEGADSSGFTMVGSGAATVVTAALFVPGAKYVVGIAGKQTVLRADGAGRLTVSGIDLGASLPVQEDLPAGQPSDPPVQRTTSVHVTIAQWRGPHTVSQ